MPRRREVPKRRITPDPKFKDKLVSKFTNTLMFNGKKATAEGILYGAFDVIQERFKEEPARGLPQGARQRQAEARGQEPARRRRDLPGPRRGSPGAPRRAGHALARRPTPASAARRRCASASPPSSSTRRPAAATP